MAERAVRDLAGAELTASPEELGLRAEFLEEWWAEQEEPMPPALAEVVARHRRSAPPPAAPVPGAQPTDADVRVARLGLLAMRGALSQQRRVSGGQCIIDPSVESVSYDAAADLLARMPKPLECHARAVGDVMAVRCRVITEPSHLAARRHSEAYWQGQGGRYPHLRTTYGDQYADVKLYWWGCDESMLATVGDSELLERDYALRPSSRGGSPPATYLASSPGAARAAAKAGAAYMISCWTDPNGDRDEEEGRVIAVRAMDEPGFEGVYAVSADLIGACDSCGQAPARWVATDVRTEPWQERRICAHCAATELAPRAISDAHVIEEWVRTLSDKGRQSAAADTADRVARLERWWKQLPAPADVVAALERCRRL